MAKVIGTISALLNLDAAQFKKGAKSANKSIKQLGRDLRRQAGPAFKSVATSGLIAAGALAVITRRANANIDALAKVSSKLGETTEKLAGFRFAAKQTGVGQKAVDVALQRVTRRLSEAAKGSGVAAGAIKELGLNAAQLSRKGPVDAVADIADAMKLLPTQADRVRIAFKLFDTEGAALVNTLAGGSEAIRKFQADAKALGIAVSRVDAAKIEAANDSMSRISEASKGLSNRLAIQLAPVITAVSDRIVQLGIESGGFQTAITTAFDAAVKVAAFFGNRIGEILIGVAAIQTAAIAAGELAGKLTDVKNVSKGSLGVLGLLFPNGDASNDDPYRGTRESLAKLAEVVEKFGNGAPGDRVQQFIDQAQAQAEAGAQKVAAAADTGGGEIAVPGLSEKQAAAQQAAYDKRIEQLRQTLMTEAELETAAFEKKIEFLATAAALDTENRALLNASIEEEKRAHEERLTKIAKKENAERERTVQRAAQNEIKARARASSAIFAMLQTFGAKSKKLAILEIALNKGKAIALAYQNTAVAITAELARLNYGGAAAVAALGAIQIAAIAATGLGQIAQVRSSGGAQLGTPANPLVTEPEGGAPGADAAGERSITIDVRGLEEGAILSGRDVRVLMSNIVEQINDGAGGGLRVALGVGI